MKHLLFETGGRPLNNDDFTVLQDEIYYAINGQFLGLPACVVAGCDVSPSGSTFNIGAGLVYLDGEIRHFAGVSGVTLPQELYSDAFTTTELRAYQTGGSKNTMGEAVVLARSLDASKQVDKVVVQPEGVLRVAKAREAQFRGSFELRMLGGYTAANFDATGRGKYGTTDYGWAMANGKNGTVAMGGRVPVGVDLGTADYGAPGKVGGNKSIKLTVGQLAPHGHVLDEAGAHQHALPSRGDYGGPNNAPNVARASSPSADDGTGSLKTKSAGTHTHTVESTGDGDDIDVRQPYASFLFAQWVGF